MRLRPRTTTLLVSLGTAAALSLQVAPAAAQPRAVTGSVRRPSPPAVHGGRRRRRSGRRARRHGVPRRHHHRRAARHDAARPVHRPGGLDHPARPRHGQPDGCPGAPGRRLLPGHVVLQQDPRLEPRQPVRAAHPGRLERRPGGDRRAGHAQAVLVGLPHLRLRAGAGLRLRVHGQGQQQQRLLPATGRSPATPSPSGTSA